MTTETTQVTLLPPACRPLPLPNTKAAVWGLRTLVFYTMLEKEQRQKNGLFESSHFECNCFKVEIRDQLLADSLEELETYYPQALLANGSVKNPEVYLDEINNNPEGGIYVIQVIAWMILMHLDTEENLQNLLKAGPKIVEFLEEGLDQIFEATTAYESQFFKRLAIIDNGPDKLRAIHDDVKALKKTVTETTLGLTSEQAAYISFHPVPAELPAAIDYYKTLFSCMRRLAMQESISDFLDQNHKLQQLEILTKTMQLLTDSHPTSLAIDLTSTRHDAPISSAGWWRRCTFRNKPQQLGGAILTSAILIPRIGLTMDLGIHHPKSWQHAFKWEKLAKGGVSNPWARASIGISSAAGFIFLALCFFYLAKKVMQAKPEALSPRAASLK